MAIAILASDEAPVTTGLVPGESTEKIRAAFTKAFILIHRTT